MESDEYGTALVSADGEGVDLGAELGGEFGEKEGCGLCVGELRFRS